MHHHRSRNKKKKRKQIENQRSEQHSIELQFPIMTPKTKNQEKVFSGFDNNNLVLTGAAGTGKTFIALYLALQDLLLNKDTDKEKIIIVRSAVPSRDMGFLPGNSKEKMTEYEKPYMGIFHDLFEGEGMNVYRRLKEHGKLQFVSTSFLRGITTSNAHVIFDEIQNMSYQELDTGLTRIGKRCKVMLIGDLEQTDLKNPRMSGMKSILTTLENMNTDRPLMVNFTWKDCVRSGFVKSYLESKRNTQLTC